ncbi:MAG: acyl-CoA reductase [Chitinophagales bacterium]
MNLKERINGFSELAKTLDDSNAELSEIIRKTEAQNPWFTEFHCRLMVKNFREKFFNPEKLHSWLKKYGELPEKNKTIGLVLAGNIPFVGMHDMLCVIMSGNRAMVKLSAKDDLFFPWVYQQLLKTDKAFENKITFVERLEGFDAVIATGSNNSARYFEYYFGKYPNIIRKNRTSISILKGDETDEEIYALGKDVFYFYGLGCRNVSKIYFPEVFDREKLFRVWEDFRYVSENTKYHNNYDYNRAILLLNQTPFLTNDFFMLQETDKLFSPISVLFCETYSSQNDLNTKISELGENIQCVVAKADDNTQFGSTQFPELNDYADNIDTMEFLKSL